MTTDSDGRFLWNDAPGDEVRVRIYAKGYVQSRGIPVVPGAQNQIVMASPTTVKGTVVDAETGRPISNFSLVDGTVWKAGNSLIWQRNGAWTSRPKRPRARSSSRSATKSTNYECPRRGRRLFPRGL